MNDQSLYERGNTNRQNSDNSVALGRITRIYPERRTCEIKTFFGNDTCEDNHIAECQWISLDGHSDGDESGAIPRINTFTLVFFIKGEPLAFGSFSPQTDDGAAFDTDNSDKEKEPLNEGDRIMKTSAGNKVIIRASGEIQIHSTNTCKTIYTPKRELLNDLCRNYEFETDGGTIQWYNYEFKGPTTFKQVFRENKIGDNLVVVERGLLEGDFISKTEIGMAEDTRNVDSEQVVYTKTTKNTGETDLFIRAPGAESGYKYHIKPDGDTDLNIGNNFNYHVKPTGEFDLDVKSNHHTNIKPTGETTINVGGKCNVNIKPSGDTIVNVGGNTIITILPSGAVTMDAKNEVSIITKTVSLTASFVKLGKSVSDVVPMGRLLLTEINKLIANFKSHTHISSLPGQQTGPCIPPASQVAIVADAVLSKTVKVQK